MAIRTGVVRIWLNERAAGRQGPPTSNREDATMKTVRYLIVGTTLTLAAVAGTSTAGTVQRAACQADALVALLGGAPANAPATCGG